MSIIRFCPPATVPIPFFDKTMYTVPENNRSTPLCVDIGVEITKPIELTVITTHRIPQQAEGMYIVYIHRDIQIMLSVRCAA